MLPASCIIDSTGGQNSVINLSGAVFPSQENLLILTVRGIRNPAATLLRTVLITSYTSKDALTEIESSGFSNFGFYTTPGSLLCVIARVDGTLADSDAEIQSSNVVA